MIAHLLFVFVAAFILAVGTAFALLAVGLTPPVPFLFLGWGLVLTPLTIDLFD